MNTQTRSDGQNNIYKNTKETGENGTESNSNHGGEPEKQTNQNNLSQMKEQQIEKVKHNSMSGSRSLLRIE